MSTVYVAVDVGCIECGEESACLGIFLTREEGEAAAKTAREWQAKNWHGQHSFEVFEATLPSALPETDEGTNR